MCCRQPEKILLPPQLSVFLSQPGQFSSLVAGQLALIRRAKITPVDSSLPNPLGQAAGGKSQPLGHVPWVQAWSWHYKPISVGQAVLEWSESPSGSVVSGCFEARGSRCQPCSRTWKTLCPWPSSSVFSLALTRSRRGWSLGTSAGKQSAPACT